MFRIAIRPHWELTRQSRRATEAAGLQGGFDTTALLALLAAVQDTGSLAQAARTMGLSYRHAWGQVKRAEAAFGRVLLDGARGKGSALTELAQKLIWAERRIAARLSPLLESLASELEGELDRSQAASQPRALPKSGPPLRLNASHGFAVAAWVEQMQLARLPVELRYRNSLESVAALAHGECDLAGFHVPIGEFEGPAMLRYRPWLRADTHSLVHLAVRTQGLFVARGNPKKIRSVDDLGRADVRFVNRPEGSGTRVLTELLLHRHGIAPRDVLGYGDTEFTHAAVAAYIASGMADAGIGVQTAAHRFGLQFIPLLRERYFFAVNTAALSQPKVQAALRLLQSPAMRAAIAALKGYQAGETGRVQTLDEAFVIDG